MIKRVKKYKVSDFLGWTIHRNVVIYELTDAAESDIRHADEKKKLDGYISTESDVAFSEKVITVTIWFEKEEVE